MNKLLIISLALVGFAACASGDGADPTTQSEATVKALVQQASPCTFDQVLGLCLERCDNEMAGDQGCEDWCNELPEDVCDPGDPRTGEPVPGGDDDAPNPRA
ncbi:MAG: hypothetical protein AB7P03_02650 [Kofleriaceae bacterium]